MTGDGIKEFFEAVEGSRGEYETCYIPELERVRAAREKTLEDLKADSMNRLMKDLAVDRAKNPDAAILDQWEAEEEDEDQEGEEIDIIDRSEDRWPGQSIGRGQKAKWRQWEWKGESKI